MKTLRPYQQDAVNECWDALKLNSNPVLLMASVGAGKSLMIADILLKMQNANKRVLCLVNNAELVRNNCETFISQGGNASIYCAALSSKDSSAPIVFGTPQSVLNAIVKEEDLASIKFNMIVVDEAHAINYPNDKTTFMRILRHYKQAYSEMRLLGATGTNFRFRGTSIVGEKCLFKTQVGNITTHGLINDGYLIEPKFEVDPELFLDFSHVKLKRNGQFDSHQLEEVVSRSARLTELICAQVVHIMETQQRRGVFFFATTKKHAEEIYSHLPPEQSAIILGGTPQHERTEILEKARDGRIRFLVNIAIISVGIDVPAYDTIAYLRPTESLVLLVQTMGRVLRLSPATGKTESLVLDFAGNIQRHRDWDNPMVQKAVQATIDKDSPLVILCPACQEMNSEHGRRCIGRINDKRCDYYFEFKDCPNPQCGVKNDIAARQCRECKEEIIDPNAKLRLLYDNTYQVEVLESEYSLTGTRGAFRINCMYQVLDGDKKRAIYEFFTPTTPKAVNMFYGQFVRKHCKDASKWYVYLTDFNRIRQMMEELQSPTHLVIARNSEGVRIKKKIFVSQG